MAGVSQGKTQRNQAGFSMIELLIVLGILGVVLGIGIFNGRQALDSQQERAAFNTLRQSAWQGATAAASRGERVYLQLSGRELSLRLGSTTGRQLRADTFPSGISTNLPQGTVLVFEPPGKVLAGMLPEPGHYWFQSGGSALELQFSVIGEVEAL